MSEDRVRIIIEKKSYSGDIKKFQEIAEKFGLTDTVLALKLILSFNGAWEKYPDKNKIDRHSGKMPSWEIKLQ